MGWGKDIHFLGTAHTASRKLREMVPESHLRPSLAQLEQTIESWWDGSMELFAPRTLRRAMYSNQRLRVPKDLLPRTGRATVAWSLEARAPYLDRKVVETASGLKDSDCATLVPRAAKKLLKALCFIDFDVSDAYSEIFCVFLHHFFSDMLDTIEFH